MGHSYAEENYLKAILKLSTPPEFTVQTNQIAAHLETTAASVTDMLKKLAGKDLVSYQRYQGASLTESGQQAATRLLRRHRLWEVFLVQTLGMRWDEVHEIAEELEHIPSDSLIERLDAFLGHPKFDPHGDPIPNAQGRYTLRARIGLDELEAGLPATVVGVREDQRNFLQHLTEKGIGLGTRIELVGRDEYDGTVHLLVDGTAQTLSGAAARNILVKPL